MVTKIVMPRLSLTMKEGTVGVWYKNEGDIVEKGELLVEGFSEKARKFLIPSLPTGPGPDRGREEIRVSSSCEIPACGRQVRNFMTA